MLGRNLVTRCTPVNRDKSHHLHTRPWAKPVLPTSALGSHTGASPHSAASQCFWSWGGCWEGQLCWGNTKESTREHHQLALGGGAKSLLANNINFSPRCPFNTNHLGIVLKMEGSGDDRLFHLQQTRSPYTKVYTRRAGTNRTPLKPPPNWGCCLRPHQAEGTPYPSHHQAGPQPALCSASSSKEPQHTPLSQELKSTIA